MYLDSYGDILTISELAELLVIGKNTAYNLIHSGLIKSFRIGRTHKIPKSEVTRYVLTSIDRSHSKIHKLQ
jgi:excisionase family DNA binding protein